MNKNTLSLVNDYGVPICARLLSGGMGYGAFREGRWALAWSDARAAVEFYDQRHMFSPLGQFVSRYHFETLNSSAPIRGFQLDGGTPEWSISEANLREFLETFTPQVEALRIQHAQGLSLVLANRGNPDAGDDPAKPLPHAPLDVLVPVASLAQASALSRDYIEQLDLGAGNWTGGQVLSQAGDVVATVSFNGRVFSCSGELIQEASAAGQFTPLDIEAMPCDAPSLRPAPRG